MRERLLWDDIIERYPDRWVILDDVDMDGSTVISGVVVQSCNDEEINDAYFRTVIDGHHYIKERTSELPYAGVINGANFSISLSQN